jgi:hypothetical protein
VISQNVESEISHNVESEISHNESEISHNVESESGSALNERAFEHYYSLGSGFTLLFCSFCVFVIFMPAKSDLSSQQDQCIMFSVVFTPPPLSHHGSVWLL